MESLNRYVYAVTKRLPENQREEIGKEIRSIVLDMAEGYDPKHSEEERIVHAIEELGRPEILAENYMDKRYLVGPAYFSNYLMVLQIVLACVFVGLSIGFLLSIFTAENRTILDFVTGYLGSIFSALMQVFAYVTLIFYFIEKNEDRMAYKEGKPIARYSLDTIAAGVGEKGKPDGKPFRVSSLEKVPKDESKISRTESIVSIFFITLFAGIILFFPEVIAAYIQEGDGFRVIPVFNLDVLRGYRLLFIVMFAADILKETVKMVYRRWNLKVAIGGFLLSTISIVLFYFIIRDPNLFNEGFFTYFDNLEATGILGTILRRAREVILYLALFGYLVENITGFYKGIKYGD